MALAPGTRLGPYEVTAQIGAGGMGEVYRARDTQLHRDVALKVLPDAVAHDSDRLARFRREAQMLAALNHPNIAQIYGIEDADGITALAMEFVPGADLAGRLASGPLPLAEALTIARQFSHGWPHVLPGAKAILYTVSTSTALSDARVEALSFADGRRTTVARGTFGRYLNSGHVLHVDNSTLFAVRFDLDRLAAVGDPWPIMPLTADANGSAQFDISNNGTFLYRDLGRDVILQWFDASGTTTSLLTAPGSYMRPNVSPDGARIAVTLAAREGNHVVVYDPRRDLPMPLTQPTGGYHSPVWTPDSQYVVYRGPDGIWWSRADGSGTPGQLLEDRAPGVFPVSFSRDTWRLAYDRIPGTGSDQNDILTVPVERSAAGLRAGTPEVFLATPQDERHGALSPDGRWMAYSSSTSHGDYNVYVKPFPDTTGAQWPVSTQGGVYPRWSPTSHEIFFRAPDNRIMVVAFTADQRVFVPEKPRLWSPTRLADVGMRLNFDVAPDGRRIAGLFHADASSASETPHHVHVLFNFFDEVRRLGR